MRFVVAVYEVDRAYGGAEEGGWWFDTGELYGVSAVFTDERKAIAYCRRLNRTLAYRNRIYGRDVNSVIYDGGALEAEVCDRTAPAHYPALYPRYE